MTTKTWLAAVGCACTLAASGMPTQAELEKAQGLVTELMRSDVANFNERKMSAADVATAALKYAGEAQSEAARFLLLKGAFFYRVRAEDYDGAMAVISKIRNDINDVPDATLVNILSSAIRSIPRKRAGRLYDLQQRLQDRALYCVIDLSAGPNARTYPVSYLDAEPKGGWTDEYKTTKLVLRRIEPGKFMMVGKYEVTLTKPFYCGVFEVTQKQYELVTGTNPSFYRGDMRPVEMVPWNVFRGNSATYNWPSSVNVDPSTFIGKIQVRTGLNFDLPTEAQWEYACRAGTTSKFNNGCDSESDLKKLGRFMLNQKERSFNDDNESFAKHEPDGKGGYSGGHTVVGSYMPNAWGLYDMHGNVWEWCLDWRDRRDKGLILSSGVTDPVGPSSGAFRVMRGGCWDSRAAACTSFTRNHANPVWVRHVVGFRLVMVSDLLKERGIKPLESSDKAAGSK